MLNTQYDELFLLAVKLLARVQINPKPAGSFARKQHVCPQKMQDFIEKAAKIIEQKLHGTN
jgi:hypothetical protein